MKPVIAGFEGTRGCGQSKNEKQPDVQMGKWDDKEQQYSTIEEKKGNNS